MSTHQLHEVFDLTDRGSNGLFNCSIDEARGRVAAGDAEGVGALDGCFALVVQDTGWNEELLRAREGRMVAAWGMGGGDGAAKSAPLDHSRGLTLKSWSGGGIRGFRTCMPSQGLCKVVGGLVAPDDPEAPLARYNVILMGPPGASDEAYAALVAGIKRDRLP